MGNTKDGMMERRSGGRPILNRERAVLRRTGLVCLLIAVLAFTGCTPGRVAQAGGSEATDAGAQSAASSSEADGGDGMNETDSGQTAAIEGDSDATTATAGASTRADPDAASKDDFSRYERIPADNGVLGEPYINLVDDGEWLPTAEEVTNTYETLYYLSARQLRLARNGFFARHGYVFKDQTLADYFGGMSWYAPDPAFKAEDLPADEKDAVDLLKAREDAAPYALGTASVMAADMDGDGADDLVQVHYSDSTEGIIRINDASLPISGECFAGTASLIDLDLSDNRLELLIPDLGPSSDDSFTLYVYQDGQILQAGAADGRILSLTGKGPFLARVRVPLLQTWFVVAPFTLDPDGSAIPYETGAYPVDGTLSISGGNPTLTEAPAVFADKPSSSEEMDTRTLLLMDLPVYAAPEGAKPATSFRKGEQVAFTACSIATWTEDWDSHPPEGWVKIATKDGRSGWVQVTNFDTVMAGGMGYPATEVFSWLCMAD